MTYIFNKDYNKETYIYVICYFFGFFAYFNFILMYDVLI